MKNSFDTQGLDWHTVVPCTKNDWHGFYAIWPLLEDDVDCMVRWATGEPGNEVHIATHMLNKKPNEGDQYQTLDEYHQFELWPHKVRFYFPIVVPKGSRLSVYLQNKKDMAQHFEVHGWIDDKKPQWQFTSLDAGKYAL